MALSPVEETCPSGDNGIRDDTRYEDKRSSRFGHLEPVHCKYAPKHLLR